MLTAWEGGDRGQQNQPREADMTASTPDPEGINVLVEAVKSRKKFPREIREALRVVEQSRPETTERIFFDCGGPPAWLAYVLTKRHAQISTGHVEGRGKRMRLVAQLERETVDTRRQWAAQLATALEAHRLHIGTFLETTARSQLPRQHKATGRRDSHDDETGRETDAEPIAPQLSRAQHPPRLAPLPIPADISPIPAVPPPKQTPDMENAADFFCEQSEFVSNASVLECTRLFPTYLARSIKRYPKPSDASDFTTGVSISLPGDVWSGCLIKFEVISPKVGHIARELFGAHLEVDNDFHYFYLSGGSRVLPDPRLILRDCRMDILPSFFGSTITDAISATEEYQTDFKEASGYTKCVTMTIFRTVAQGAYIYALVAPKDGAILREKLYK